MTDKERLTLECPEKMCESCCNFDKEHIGMDGTALCKLTMTLAYAEDYGGNCMFYNVPKEQIIVPPCKVGDKVFWATTSIDENCEKILTIEIGEVCSFSLQEEGLWAYCRYESGLTYWHLVADFFGKTVFLTKEEAEAELRKRS